MEDKIYRFKPAYNELQLNLRNIRAAIGYPDGEAPDWFEEVLQSLLKQAKDIVTLNAGFRLIPPGRVSQQRDALIVDETTFQTERIIAGQLKKIEGAALFAATIGKDFDKWSRSFFNDGDPMTGYTADLIGSEIAESLADWLERRVVEIAESRGLGCSNRYSPGYCGWDVSEQHWLFQFFPQDFCDVHLTASALMLPIKSVSGLIGLGKDLKKKDYQCNLCNLEHCYKRNKRDRQGVV